MRSPILAALLHGTPAAVVSQSLRRGTRNGIMELSQRAPPIFRWAAITLGIGPHSSFKLLTKFVLKVIVIVRETSLLVVLGCGLGWIVCPNFSFVTGFVGLGWVSQLVGLVGLGQRKSTNGQL